MAGIRRDLNDPIVKGTTQFDNPAAGSLTFGVSPSLFAGGSGAPISPTGGSSGIPLGGGTYLNIDFGGLGDAFLADLIDLIKFLQSDIEKTGGSESTKPIQEALDRWTKLLNDYQNGDATLEDLKNFDPGPLGSTDVWSDYYDGFISGEEGVVLGGVESTGEFGDETVVLPPLLPPKTESKRTDGGGATGGGGLMTSGGGDTTAGPGPATESKQTTDGGDTDTGGGDDTGDGRLDVLGEDWEYDPEHDYIYVGDCTFIRVDENGNPIGDPYVVDAADCSIFTVGGNYSGPDSVFDPTREPYVDIFGEGSIVDTTKDNVTEPEQKDKDEDGDDGDGGNGDDGGDGDDGDTGVIDVGTGTGGFETGTGTTDTGPATESKRTTGGDGGAVTPTTGTTGGGGPATESKQTTGGDGDDVTPTTGTTGGTGTPTESKRTDGGDGDGGDGDGGDGDGGTGPNTEGVITFSNMYGYYSNKDDGGGDGGGGDGGGGDGGGGDDGTGDDGSGDDGGEDGSMFKDVSLGGTGSSSFSPFQAIPGYTAPTYAPINVPQQDYMAEINNLIARNSSMFKGLI